MFELVGIAPSTETIPGMRSTNDYPQLSELFLSVVI